MAGNSNSGWRNRQPDDSYRHYLASKGYKSTKDTSIAELHKLKTDLPTLREQRPTSITDQFGRSFIVESPPSYEKKDLRLLPDYVGGRFKGEWSNRYQTKITPNHQYKMISIISFK